MRRIDSSIIIFAPAKTIWDILTDFAAYPDWNPFIRAITGELAVGTRLTVRIEPPGRRQMIFRPTITAVERPQELRWTGRVLLPGLFKGEHVFAIEPSGSDRCRFRQSETFSGLAAPLFARSRLAESTRQGFAAMNRALQRRAETLPRSRTASPV